MPPRREAESNVNWGSQNGSPVVEEKQPLRIHPDRTDLIIK